MYNILIVDDEVHAVRGVVSAIEWEKLGVTGIYSAYNIRQAMEVLEKEKIDLMLCDIEMPQGSGLELLRWVKNNYPFIVSMFLTCHADFNYAKEAVQLGVLEYMLKPARSEELEAVIRKAVNKINQDREAITNSETYKYYYQLWSTHQPLLVERFWLDLLQGNISRDPVEIEKMLANFDIPYHKDMKFVQLLISIKHWNSKFTPQDEKINEGLLKTEIDMLLQGNEGMGRVICLDKGVYLAILTFEGVSLDCSEYLRHNCSKLINFSNEQLQFDISCYIGIPAAIQEMPDILVNLRKLDEDNVAISKKVFFMNESTAARGYVKLPVMGRWSEMLVQGERTNLISEIDSALDGLSRQEGLNAGVLHEFYRNFIQIVYYVLQQKGLLAHQIFTTEELEEKEKTVIRSITELREWTRYIADKVIDSIQSAAQAQTLTERIKQYITQNINNELSRESLAATFHISPDYLSRLFKKDTGLSISEYLINERINIAKDLLINTNMPVSEIVSFIGYTNFSHFSKIFRKATGLNPLDYRKRKHEG